MEPTILVVEENNQSIRQPLIDGVSMRRKKYAGDSGTESGREGYSRGASQRRWHLSRDLNEVREQVI